MKFINLFSNIVQTFFLLAVIIFQTANVSSQSAQGKINSPEPETKLPNAAEENKTEDFSNLEPFEYIEPKPTEDFIKILNELGAKKYRLRDLTQIPVGIKREFKGNRDVTRLTLQLAGIAKLDEAKYEYRILDVEKTRDLAKSLNDESREGFNPREVIAYSSAMEFGGNTDDALLQSIETLASLPRLNSLILLEREVEKQDAPRAFQVLRAGFGYGKKPTEKMNALLAESIKQKFYPIALFLRQDFGGKTQKDDESKFIDYYYAVIVQEMNEEPAVELEFVRALTWGTFNKRVNELAAKGYKIGDTGYIYGMMIKEREEKPSNRKKYQWLSTKSKSFAVQLAGFANAGGRLSGTGMYPDMVEQSDKYIEGIHENRLIFEMPSAGEATRYEYQILPMIGDAPQTSLIGKTVVAGDDPMQKFKRLIKQGYLFTNLIYADKKITAIFERQRSN